MSHPRRSPIAAAPILRRLRRFLHDERGAISAWALFLFMTTCAIGAAAVDVTHLFAARTQIQAAADNAARAAIFRRNRGDSAAAARAAAIAVVEYGMPDEVYGQVISAADIRFGTYDPATDRFRVSPENRNAVLVTAAREEASTNPVGTLLFRMVGVDRMDVSASAVAIRYVHRCLEQGFVANGVVNVTSNNRYVDFCIHSNTHVEFNNNNSFEGSTLVTMPHPEDLVLPGSGFSHNPGLATRVTDDEFVIGILDRVRPGAADPLETGLLTVGDDDRPSYLNSTTVVDLGTGSVSYSSPSAFTQGRVHRRTCSSASQSIRFTDGVYSSFVLLTNCQIEISGKTDLRDVVIYTTSTDANSVKFNSAGGGSQGVVLGLADNCAEGGGAQIITRGGVHSSAKLTMNGAQIIALGSVRFASQASGIGASIIADGRIDGTTNMTFTGCATGLEENFVVAQFRLAR